MGEDCRGADLKGGISVPLGRLPQYPPEGAWRWYRVWFQLSVANGMACNRGPLSEKAVGAIEQIWEKVKDEAGVDN